MEVVIAALQGKTPAHIKEDYVLISSRGTKVMSFDTPAKAREWQTKQVEKHSASAPVLKLHKITTITQEL